MRVPSSWSELGRDADPIYAAPLCGLAEKETALDITEKGGGKITKACTDGKKSNLGPRWGIASTWLKQVRCVEGHV
jgi:hypothetical protein